MLYLLWCLLEIIEECLNFEDAGSDLGYEIRDTNSSRDGANNFCHVVEQQIFGFAWKEEYYERWPLGVKEFG